MKRRDTEESHGLGDTFFKRANVFDIQGLLINSDNKFSASIEAFELTKEEIFTLELAFTPLELHAKMLISEKLKVPFYIITYIEDTSFFSVHTIVRNNSDVLIESIDRYSFDKFIQWWKNLKGTLQTKSLSEAGKRIAKSKIDQVLATESLSWGGNIDGFILSKDGEKILGVLEKRLSTKASINTYDPANYFRATHYRGGDYNTWLPLVNLSKELKCPLFLLTLHKENHDMFGIAVIDKINNEELIYKSGPPCSNLFSNIIMAKNWMYRYMI